MHICDDVKVLSETYFVFLTVAPSILTVSVSLQLFLSSVRTEMVVVNISAM